MYRGANSEPFWIRKRVPYALSATLRNMARAIARGPARGGRRHIPRRGICDFRSGNGTATAAFTSASDGRVYLSALCIDGTTLTGDCTFADIQLEAGSAATEYEPYRDLGGGTVTPSAPLYGLPGAEDTVEISVDGGRTGDAQDGGGDARRRDLRAICAPGPDERRIRLHRAADGETGRWRRTLCRDLCSHFAVIPRNAIQANHSGDR